MTSIVVTHDMKSAVHVGDRIAHLHEGRIDFHGTPAELEKCDVIRLSSQIFAGPLRIGDKLEPYCD